jgi:hypothetical protein
MNSPFSVADMWLALAVALPVAPGAAVSTAKQPRPGTLAHANHVDIGRAWEPDLRGLNLKVSDKRPTRSITFVARVGEQVDPFGVVLFDVAVIRGAAPVD